MPRQTAKPAGACSPTDEIAAPMRGRRVRREDTPLRGVDTPLRGLCDFSEHTPLHGV